MRNQRASTQQRTAEQTTFRAAAYLRVSTDEQKESGLGIEVQRSRCINTALGKGWPEPVVYPDEGISGTKDASKRPALQRLLTDAREGKVDAVIILSLDRLGRKTRLVLDLVEELTACGVVLVSCKESLDTQTATGKFVLSLFASLAQLERDLIAERTKAALGEKRKQDGEAGGRLPYGYLRTDAGLLVDAEAARTVRYIFGCKRRGDSMRAIAEKLNQQNIPSPRGGRWFHTTIREILDNRSAYVGGKRGESDVRWPVILAA